MKCPKCKEDVPDSYYCIHCGKKLKDFRRIEVSFAIHATNKNLVFDYEKIWNILSGNIDGDIANLKVKEVNPKDRQA